MEKYKYLLLTLFIPLLLPTTIYAECTEEEIAHFKEIENQYTVTDEFDANSKKYTLNIKNPDFKQYIYDSTAITKYMNNITKISDSEIKINNVDAGEYTFVVRSMNDSCDKILKSISINLAKYNNYSEDPLCDGIEEFVLCQPTYDKVIDYDTFVARVKLYKENKEKEENAKPKQEEKEENKVVKYIKDNLFQTIIIIVFIIIVSITAILTIRSAKQSRRLE